MSPAKRRGPSPKKTGSDPRNAPRPGVSVRLTVSHPSLVLPPEDHRRLLHAILHRDLGDLGEIVEVQARTDRGWTVVMRSKEDSGS